MRTSLSSSCVAEKERRVNGPSFCCPRIPKNCYGFAIDVEKDANGRLLIPQEIRSSCSLNRKEVVLVGLGQHFELWDAQKLEESEEQAKSENLSEIAAAFNF